MTQVLFSLPSFLQKQWQWYLNSWDGWKTLPAGWALPNWKKWLALMHPILSFAFLQSRKGMVVCTMCWKDHCGLSKNAMYLLLKTCRTHLYKRPVCFAHKDCDIIVLPILLFLPDLGVSPPSPVSSACCKTESDQHIYWLPCGVQIAFLNEMNCESDQSLSDFGRLRGRRLKWNFQDTNECLLSLFLS